MNKQSEITKRNCKMKTEKQSQDLRIQKMNQKIANVSNPDMQMVMLKGVEKHKDSKAMVFWDKKQKRFI
jgi:hypothetical protein